MPMRNAEKWVSQTILSIQNQTFKDWELIIVDDFSVDRSCEIVKSFVDKDERINLKINRMKGIIPALQLGYSYCSGMYLTRMDADDLMPVTRLELMLNVILSSPPKTIVTGKVAYFSDGEISEGYKKYEDWLNERIDKNDHFQHVFRECVIASPNWLIENNDSFCHDIFCHLHYPEDYDLVFRWFAAGNTIHSIPETTLLWREHPERTSRNSKIYDQASFFELKVNWFIKLFPNIKSVGIVGMGQKGKLLAKLFRAKNYPFQLYDLEPNKFVGLIEGQKVKDSTEMNGEILLIARYPENLKEIQNYIESFGYEIGKNAFWV